MSVMERFKRGGAKKDNAKNVLERQTREHHQKHQQQQEEKKRPSIGSPFVRHRSKVVTSKVVMRDSRGPKELREVQVDIDQAFKNGKFKEEQNKLLQRQQENEEKHSIRVARHAEKESDLLQTIMLKNQSPRLQRVSSSRTTVLLEEMFQERDDSVIGDKMALRNDSTTREEVPRIKGLPGCPKQQVMTRAGGGPKEAPLSILGTLVSGLSHDMLTATDLDHKKTDTRERHMEFEYTPSSRKYFTNDHGIELEIDTSEYNF